MKEFVEYVVKAPVDYPDEVTVREVDGERTVVFELRLNKSDIGKVIGKNGRVGTTGRVDADVRLAAGTPQGLGLWAYLSRLTNVSFQPFGTNPHTGLVLT